MRVLTIILAIIFSLNAFPLRQNEKASTKNNYQMTKEQVAYTLERAGFPREIVPVVTCLAQYESNFKPNIVNHHNTNSTKDHGLMQINDIWMHQCKMTAKDLRNPLKNARCALKVYKSQGLTAWVTYNKFKRVCLTYKIPNYNSTTIAEVIIKNNDLM